MFARDSGLTSVRIAFGNEGARLPPAVGIVSPSCRILLTNTAVDMWLSSAAPSSWRPPALKTCATTLWALL